MTVWRARMKSGSAGVDHAAARQFAFSEGLVGAGWGLNNSSRARMVPDGSGDTALYYQHAMFVHGDDSFKRAFDAIANRMKVDDYCWTYVTHLGEYWCCRVTGPFAYREGASFDTFDWHMTRTCTWARVGSMDAVPGAIRRAFAGPFGTITALTNGVERAVHAAELALGLTPSNTISDLFRAAGPEDLEDLIALYLQSKGWFIYPSTAKVSTASYEFVLANASTGERAGVQVKSGNAGVGEIEVASDLDKFFVFAPALRAETAWKDQRITLIGSEEVRKFAKENWAILPKRLRADWLITV